MPDVEVGDVLRMNRATLIGSRDYSLRAAPVKKGEPQKYLDESLFVCRVRVVGETQEPLRVKEKSKRRRRHVKHIWSKHKYTVLRVTELDVIKPPSPEERLVQESS
jgi:large subunit ribosomal protein L21